jgi:hypothetical protein
MKIIMCFGEYETADGGGDEARWMEKLSLGF